MEEEVIFCRSLPLRLMISALDFLEWPISVQHGTTVYQPPARDFTIPSPLDLSLSLLTIMTFSPGSNEEENNLRALRLVKPKISFVLVPP
jgi:hypothetical protein